MEATAVADSSSNIALRIARRAAARPSPWPVWLLVDVATGSSRTLAEAVDASRRFNFGGVAWSPDGTRLAFTAREDPDVR
jgi:Tol biopolymer transport system component